MLKIENVEVTGWEAAIRGMRNPMNSWAKSDTLFFDQFDTDIEGVPTDAWYHDICKEDHSVEPWTVGNSMELGPDDHRVMMLLAKEGSVDAKYRRMINVTLDITAPLYWWKEFDAYKVGTVANSCSTMHKIHAKEFTLDDFSHEHLISIENLFDKNENEQDIPLIGIEMEDSGALVQDPLDIFNHTISMLNRCRTMFLETKDKRYWWQLIQLLPSSYNQRRTVQVNYEVLAGIYPKRKDHKLDEWHTFCDWIKTLPYSEIITLEE